MLEKKLDWFARAETGPDAMALFLEKTAFFVSLCEEGCRSGELVMTVLYVGDVRVAAVLGFMLGDRFIAQMLAWDFTWEPSGPGRLTLEDAIRWGLEHRAKTIDLGLGTEEYKYRFASADVAAVRNVFVAAGFLGEVAVVWLRRLRNIARQTAAYGRSIARRG